MIAAAIVCDWGTSSLRCYLVDAQGHVREERSNADGLLAMSERSYPQVLEDLVGDWLQTDLPVLFCGMVGSARGWHEVPYIPCPASVSDLAEGMLAIEWGDGRRGWIVPGVSHHLGTMCEVMRGEETQVTGYMHLNSVQDALVCLPGTHSKYVQVRGGVITDLRTHMTGELFALLRSHGILAGTMEEAGGGAGIDVVAFKRGVDHTGCRAGCCTTYSRRGRRCC
jgi:2-dehydro-3-deoxygalactonokinase